MLERIAYNLLQVFVVAAFAPLVEGVTTRLKEIIQSKRGPSIFQPYRDIWKLLHKDEIVSEYSTWIFRALRLTSRSLLLFLWHCSSPS
jgi:formate hydrogenlyase subunit 4